MHPWHLDKAVLHFGSAPVTWRMLFEGTAITGETGSGKTSGPFAALARAALSGAGILAITAKEDDRKFWERLCRETGRIQDFRVFAPRDGRFNFIDWLGRTGGKGARLTDNQVSLFERIQELRGQAASGGGGENAFFQFAARQAHVSALDILSAAGDTTSIPAVYELLTSAPPDIETVASEEWLANSACAQAIARAAGNKNLTEQQARDVKTAMDYLLCEWPGLDERTRSNVLVTLTSVFHPFLRGLLAESFSTTTTLSPDDVLAGRVVICDFPPTVYQDLGQAAGVIWKLCFQIAAQRRPVSGTSRPLALFIDEAPLTVVRTDASFQGICRQARVMSVYAAQNLPGYHAAFGSKSEHIGSALTQSLLGNLATKIFASNSCTITNDYAAKLVGYSFQERDSYGASSGGGSQGPNGSINTSLERRFIVEPLEFQQLKRGPENGSLVQTICFRGGAPWKTVDKHDQKNHLRVSFRQS